MTEPRPSQVLGGLPRSRPHRRSPRRPAVPPITATGKPAAAAGESAMATGERAPAGTTDPTGAAAPTVRAAPMAKISTHGADPTIDRPARPPATPGATATRTDVLGTAVQAAAELAEIGLTIGARSLRNALSRLPHP